MPKCEATAEKNRHQGEVDKDRHPETSSVARASLTSSILAKHRMPWAPAHAKRQSQSATFLKSNFLEGLATPALVVLPAVGARVVGVPIWSTFEEPPLGPKNVGPVHNSVVTSVIECS